MIEPCYFDSSGKLYYCDNLTLLNQLEDNSVDLVYIDPPFSTGMVYKTKEGEICYEDKYSLEELIEFLTLRIQEIYRVLKKTGSFYLHGDSRFIHYVKIECDKIFGIENFRNEVIWYYISGGVSNKAFARKHDSILFYSKVNNYTFNLQKQRKKEVNLSKIEEDEKGQFIWYIRPGTNPKVLNGVKSYIDGFVTDVWDIPIVNVMAKERMGYASQKPESLLERIIKTSSNKGDLVVDIFCGSGTTLVVAKRFERNYIGCDNSKEAIEITKRRLHKTRVRRDLELLG